MTRFAIDAATAVRLVRDHTWVPGRHQLVGPSVLRSHALALLHREVRAGALTERDGRRDLEALAGLKVRLLGDRVSRAVAWSLALQHGWDDTADAEYLAVASLQADALVTDDPALAAAAEGVVPLAPYADLLR
ncbi:hypothetical protein INN71_04260 [Nocardioides sp. ChNu-153]|uniref:hypothetical protein n=1 Tax=unclassified Nocardioides TaxID=2615069 RepID=UPI002406F026|nr:MULTISPECIES: hypothetical protein [unclassified Nocardioides]MDF9715438.1 hypothetical protein [Nocardioides sp. ChNu-99]MDN7120601.1 hypothetical protein [Nocardioides sp. ChNu-153]